MRRDIEKCAPLLRTPTRTTPPTLARACTWTAITVAALVILTTTCTLPPVVLITPPALVATP